MSGNTPINSSTPSGAQPAPMDLSEFDDEYAAVEPATNDEVPDGRYEVGVNSVKLGESQKGNRMLTWDLVVLSGQHANRHIFKNAVITKASMRFVKGDLKILGLKLPRFRELPEHLKDLEGLTLEVTTQTKGEYTNVYFKKRIPVPADEPGMANGAPF